MNIYSIYVNTEKKDNNCVIIKQSFSITAAIFNAIWALYHRMWLLLIVVLIGWTIAFSFNCGNINMLLPIATILVFGFCHDDMREYDLEKKQYILQDIILANSKIEAELQFLARLKS